MTKLRKRQSREDDMADKNDKAEKTDMAEK